MTKRCMFAQVGLVAIMALVLAGATYGRFDARPRPRTQTATDAAPETSFDMPAAAADFSEAKLGAYSATASNAFTQLGTLVPAGKPAPSREDRAGHFTVVVFVHSNCCGAPAARVRLARLEEQYRDKQVNFFSVDFDDYSAALAQFIKVWQPQWSPKSGRTGAYAGELRDGFRFGPGNAFIFDRDGNLLHADIVDSQVEMLLSVMAGC